MQISWKFRFPPIRASEINKISQLRRLLMRKPCASFLSFLGKPLQYELMVKLYTLHRIEICENNGHFDSTWSSCPNVLREGYDTTFIRPRTTSDTTILVKCSRPYCLRIVEKSEPLCTTRLLLIRTKFQSWNFLAVVARYVDNVRIIAFHSWVVAHFYLVL